MHSYLFQEFGFFSIFLVVTIFCITWRGGGGFNLVYIYHQSNYSLSFLFFTTLQEEILMKQ